MLETLNTPTSKSRPVLDNVSASVVDESGALCWRVHLLRRDPKRLPILLLVMAVGASCVWLMFGTLLPVLAALLLLTGSINEYLFPITYRVTASEIVQESLTSRIQLSWSDVRRCQIGRNALLLTTLAAPSRLDAFRGILLHFAPEEEPGGKASLCATIAGYAPHVFHANVSPTDEEEASNTDAAVNETSEESRMETPQA